MAVALVIKAAEVGLTDHRTATVVLLLIQVLADMGHQWVGRLDLPEDLPVGMAEAEAATAETLNVKAPAGMMTGTASVLVTRYPTFSSSCPPGRWTAFRGVLCIGSSILPLIFFSRLDVV